MAKLMKYPQRAFLPRGGQREFIILTQNKLGLSLNDLALKVGVHRRTLFDWKREKYSMSLGVLKTLCRLTKSPLPKKLKIKNPFWYTSLGAKIGAKKAAMTMIKKYGYVGGSPDYRKKKWYEWWEKEGKFKTHPIINVCKPFNKPEPSEKLAEFIGIMMGDGGMTPSQFCITLHHIDDLEFSHYVARLIKKLFEVTPSITNIAKDSVNRILVSRSGLVKYLNSLGVVIGSKVKQQFDIPDWIKGDNNYLKACIRGLVDTDGCVILHKYKVNGKQYFYKKLGFTTMSTPLRQTVFNTLVDWGFNPRISQNRDIRLESQKDVKNYFDIIGSHNPKHLKKYQN